MEHGNKCSNMTYITTCLQLCKDALCLRIFVAGGTSGDKAMCIHLAIGVSSAVTGNFCH